MHTTGGMSSNATGAFNTRLSDSYGKVMEPSGNVRRSEIFSSWRSGSGEAKAGVNYTIDVSHSHTYFGDIETRPQNYTIKVWKRTA